MQLNITSEEISVRGVLRHVKEMWVWVIYSSGLCHGYFCKNPCVGIVSEKVFSVSDFPRRTSRVSTIPIRALYVLCDFPALHSLLVVFIPSPGLNPTPISILKTLPRTILQGLARGSLCVRCPQCSPGSPVLELGSLPCPRTPLDFWHVLCVQSLATDSLRPEGLSYPLVFPTVPSTGWRGLGESVGIAASFCMEAEQRGVLKGSSLH